MIRSQRFLIVSREAPEHEINLQVEKNGCVGYFREIPLILRGLAVAEAWSLPHVWTETWDDGVSE